MQRGDWRARVHEALRILTEEGDPGPLGRLVADAPDARALVDARVGERLARGTTGFDFDTPWDDADRMAAAMPPGAPPSWWGDPCVGAGRLLIAAWGAWTERDVDLAAVRTRLVATDVDATSVAVAADALALAVAATVVKLVEAGRDSEAAALAEAERAATAPRVADALGEALADRRDGWVLTNPPFESIRAMHRRLGGDRVAELRAACDVCRGAFDLGIPIVARALSRASWAALVVPASWLSADYAAPIRGRLTAFGAWELLRAPGRAFRAAVDTLVVSAPSACASPFVWAPDRSRPPSWRRLSDVAQVSGGTPGFDAQAVADALVDGADVPGWPLVTSAGVHEGAARCVPIRFMRRKLACPTLPHGTVMAETRRALYSAPKILVPGVYRALRAGWDPDGVALGVNVHAVVTDAPGFVLAWLHTAWADAWVRRAYPGATLSGGYRRLSTAALGGLPVPSNNLLPPELRGSPSPDDWPAVQALTGALDAWAAIHGVARPDPTTSSGQLELF